MMSSNKYVDMKATSCINYKAAIELNNIGVALLIRRHYNDALVSFQNGFTLMNSSLKEYDSNDTNKVLNQSILLPQEMLHQASINLAQSSTVKTQGLHDDRSDILHPIILTADRTSNSIFDLLNMPTSTDNCYALRIEDAYLCDFDETVPVNDYMMEIAIILNNIGTVYRCYASDRKSSSSSSSRKSSSKKSKSLRKAINTGLSFCSVSRSILVTMAGVESTEDEFKRQGLLSLLILDNLMNLSSAIRDIENSRQYYIEHGDIRSMLIKTLFSDDDDSTSSSDEVGSCFYLEEDLFHVTTVGAA